MAQLQKTARAICGNSFATARFEFVRRVASLIAIAFLALTALPAQAQDCSDYPNGVLDGFAGDVVPSQLQVHRNCTTRNFPASNPLRTNFSFFTQPGQTNERRLIVFDSFSIVPAGEQIILEVTAVLDDPSANSPSTQCVNTAKWDFGTYEIATQ